MVWVAALERKSSGSGWRGDALRTMIEGNVFWLCESDGALLDMYGWKSVYGRRWDG